MLSIQKLFVENEHVFAFAGKLCDAKFVINGSKYKFFVQFNFEKKFENTI
jgi:hypothetical protein